MSAVLSVVGIQRKTLRKQSFQSHSFLFGEKCVAYSCSTLVCFAPFYGRLLFFVTVCSEQRVMKKHIITLY